MRVIDIFARWALDATEIELADEIEIWWSWPAFTVSRGTAEDVAGLRMREMLARIPD